MAKNIHKVPKPQWAKWNKTEQAAFDRLWYRLYPHLLPSGVKMTNPQLNILRFNVCWEVADMMKAWRGKW